MSKETLNYVFLTLFSLVIFTMALIVILITTSSFQAFSIADILPLLIAFLFSHKIYTLIRKSLNYKGRIGLEVFKGVKKFLSKNKFVLIFVVFVGFVIYFREVIPSNIATSVLFLFLNPFGQLTLKLIGFFGKFTAEIITILIELWFVYLIVSVTASLFGKTLKKGLRLTKRK